MLSKKMGSAILVATLVVGTPLLAGSANSWGLAENARNGLGASEIVSAGMFGTGTGTDRVTERYSKGKSGANGSGQGNGSGWMHQKRNRNSYGKSATAGGDLNGVVTRNSDGSFSGSNGASRAGQHQNQAGQGRRREKN